MSLPIIHSLHNSTEIEKAQITGIFRGGRGADGLLPEVKALVLKYLDEKTHSLAYVREMLKGMEASMKKNLAEIEHVSVPNPLLKNLLARLEI